MDDAQVDDVDLSAYFTRNAVALEEALSEAVNAAMDSNAEDPIAAAGMHLLGSLAPSARVRALASLLRLETEALSRSATYLDLATLRLFLVDAQAAASAAEAATVAFQEQGRPALSSRAGYLVPLVERLGAPPARQWVDEWIPARAETTRIRHAAAKGMDPAAIPEQQIRSSERNVAHNQPLAQMMDKYKYMIDRMVAAGWPRADAEPVTVISRCCDTAIGRALRERNPRFAAMTYVGSSVALPTLCLGAAA